MGDIEALGARDDLGGYNVARAAVARRARAAHKLKFAGVGDRAEPAALNMSGIKEATSSWNRIYFVYTLTGKRPGFDAARCRAGKSVKRRQLGTDE